MAADDFGILDPCEPVPILRTPWVKSVATAAWVAFGRGAIVIRATIPSVDNRTEVLILQHRRERFHPFNTARIVHRSLRNSTMLADHVPGIAARLTIGPRAGLLYPGTDATLLTEVPATSTSSATDRH